MLVKLLLLGRSLNRKLVWTPMSAALVAEGRLCRLLVALMRSGKLLGCYTKLKSP